MHLENEFTRELKIRFPVILAPMFLVSNLRMMEAGMDVGIMSVFPTLNFREEGELTGVLNSLNSRLESGSKGNYGVNLIVQKTNPLYKKHLEECVNAKVPFYITSLGSPKEVIEKAHAYGGKVFCDVTNIKHAQKCYDLGCDGFIAVGQGAGGHAGPFPIHLLLTTLRKAFPDKMVVAAGGFSHGSGLASVLALGGVGVSVGTRFIACVEASVNDGYKKAVVDSKMEDIVLTTRLSGTPCTVINTPFVQKIGTDQNWLEKMLSTNSKTKKYFKMLVQYRGMKRLEASVQPGNYKTLWCAGQSVELVDEIAPIADIVMQLESETFDALAHIGDLIKD